MYGGVPHQVLNTGVLLAEAVNVGGARWNSSFVQPVCYCPGTVVSPIRRNRASMEYINWTPIPFRECSVAGCQVASSTAVHARAHARQHEPGSGSASFSCRLCPRVYLKEGFLGTTSLRLITLLRRVSLKEPAPLVGGPMDGPLVATWRRARGGPSRVRGVKLVSQPPDMIGIAKRVVCVQLHLKWVMFVVAICWLGVVFAVEVSGNKVKWNKLNIT